MTPGRSDTPSAADENGAPNNKKSASVAEMLGELGDYELLERSGAAGRVWCFVRDRKV